MTKEISIIGGSAAGFYVASLLAENGLNVRVFEEADTIDPLPRSLIVTRYYRDVLGDVGEGTVVNRIRRFELFTDGKAASVSLKEPDLVTDRRRLIKALAAKAEARGTEFLAGRRLLGLEPGGRALTLRFSCRESGEVVQERVQNVVGADGAFSRVAQSAGYAPPDTLSLVQAVVDLPEDLSPDTVRVWFIPRETPYFFWLIPHSPTEGVIGLIGEEAQSARDSLEHFMARKGLKAKEFQGSWVPLYTNWIKNPLRVGRSSIYLVGDAARHVKATTVGGLVTGFRGALGVAEAILNGGESRELRALRRELDRHKIIRDSLNRFEEGDYSRLLDMLTDSTRASLGRFNRDQSGKLLSHLVIKQPRLILLCLRSLLLSRQSREAPN